MARRLGTIAIVALSLFLFLPLSTTLPELEPDLSFRVVNHHSFLQRLQAGREIISTFGPWGFLFRGYHPATNALLFLLNGALGAVFGGVLARWWRHPAPSGERLLTILGAIAVLLPAGPDARYFALLSLIAMAGFQETGRRPEVALGIAAALTAQIKFSYCALAFALVALYAIEQFRKRRPVAPMAASFAAAFLGWWLAAGQNPLNLPVWFSRSLDMAAGYSAGGSLPPGAGIRFDLLFIGAAAALVLLLGLLTRHVLPAVSSALLLFFLFKASYVRYDDMHALTAMSAIGSFALLALPPHLADRSRTVRALLTAAAAGALLLAAPYGMERARFLAAAARDGGIATAWNGWMKQARAATPVEAAAGTVDSYHHGQAALLAHGLQYAGRPIFQSYLAWTPSLARINAGHLGSPSAPQFVRVEFQPVDLHLALMEDGPSWIEILRRYQRVGGRVMERRPAPLPVVRRKVLTRTLMRGEYLSLPPTDGVLIAEISVRTSPAARLRQILYRGRVETFAMRFGNGSETRFRLSPAAEAGFIVSPHMTDIQFLEWSRMPNAPPGLRPVAILVDARVDVTLFEVQF